MKAKIHILITGASSGLGQAIAIEFARPESKIGIHFSKNESGAELTFQKVKEKGGEPYLIQSDFSDKNSAKTFCEKISEKSEKIDALVLNAGITSVSFISNSSEKSWDDVINVNYVTNSKIISLISENKMASESHIILTGSLVGVRGQKAISSYSASKGAIHGLVRDAAKRLADKNIFVNEIIPGLLKTEMTKNVDDEKFSEMVSENILGRGTTHEEVAKMAVFLTTLKNVSGQSFFLDSRISN